MSRPYNKENVERALTHHESGGVIHTWSPPEPGGRKTYRLVFTDRTLEPIEASLRETWLICLAITAARHTMNW